MNGFYFIYTLSPQTMKHIHIPPFLKSRVCIISSYRQSCWHVFQNIIICLTCICFELGCGCYQYTQSNITLASNLIFSVIVTIAYFCVPFMTKLTFLFAPFHVSVYPYGYYISCITKTHMYTLVCNLWSEKCTFGYTSRRSPWMQ